MLASIFVVLLSSSASFDARDVVKVVVDDAKDLFGKDEDKERPLLLLPLFEIDDDDDKGRSMEEEDTDAFNMVVIVVLFCVRCVLLLFIASYEERAFLSCGDVSERENPKTSSH